VEDNFYFFQVCSSFLRSCQCVMLDMNFHSIGMTLFMRKGSHGRVKGVGLVENDLINTFLRIWRMMSR
jgi:hypothetical protein